MPQALKDRPGAKLKGIDRLLSKIYRTTSPALSGRTLGLTWAAWQSDDGYKVYVLDGQELITRPDLRHGRRRLEYHRADDEEGIYWLLARLHSQRTERETPLEDLQRFIRRQTDKKCHHLWYSRRHERSLSGRQVKTERRRDGKMMNWIE